ncbi:MAG: DUF4097 family beta strand repeat-containing protein [Phycisphaerales bacterium]
MKKIIFVVFVSIAFVFAGCNPKEKYKRTVEMPLPITANQKLIVSTDVGSITINESNLPQPNLKAEITGKGETLEQAQKVAESVKIKIETQANGDICLKIDKPFEIKSDWLIVDYTLNVPTDISLDCRTDVGSITIKDIKGDIYASCDVGSINCDNVSGNLKLQTDVGDIHAKCANDSNCLVKTNISTDVGSIHFKGPENMSAKIAASSDVGKINSAQPGTKQKDGCEESFNGTAGSGQGDIRLSTDVGSIDIE